MASFIETLRRDFPSADIRLPVFYASMQDFLSQFSSADYVLHLDVEYKTRIPIGLMAANGFVSFLTLSIIPIYMPERYSVQSRLQSAFGASLASMDSTSDLTIILGLPVLFSAFSDEHRFRSAPAKVATEECRIILKALSDNRQEHNPSGAHP